MKKLALFLGLTLMVYSLTACGGKEEEAVENPEVWIEESTETPEEEEPAPAEDAEIPSEEGTAVKTYPEDDNFAVSSEDATAFGAAVKEAVAAKDLAALDTGAVFSEEMLAAMEAADETALSPGMAGFTLLDAEAEASPAITFGLIEGVLKITGINY